MSKNSKDAYQEYLEKKHSQFNTNRALIDSLVNEAAGSPIMSIKKLMEGEVNEVYDVVTNSKQRVIVRISRRKYPSFEKEKRIIEEVRKLGVPAPKVLLIKRVKADLCFSIEEKIPGVPFRDIKEKLDKVKARKIVTEAGLILSIIHSIEAPGFGSLAENNLYENWRDLVLEIERNPKNSIQYKHEIVDQEKIDKAIEILRQNIKYFDIKKPQLLHSDFGTKHWLIHKGKISGILDFEGAKGGDPMYDFAWVNFFYSNSVPVKWLLEGYKNREDVEKDFDYKLKLYNLLLSLRLLEYYISEDNWGGINHCVNQLDKTLKLFP